MNNIKITLETLYDILRNEKKRDDLQQLEASFFNDVVSYINEKTSLLESLKGRKDLFSSGEMEKLEYELRSIRRILKEIYEKREKKIINIALNRSRTGSDIIDISSMLKEEEEFYHRVLKILDFYRSGILTNLFQGKLPVLGSEKVVENKLIDNKIIENTLIKNKNGGNGNIDAEKEEGTRIRFIHPMPSFVWKDMKVYGPYDVGEEITIFPEVAELLIRKKRAEKS